MLTVELIYDRDCPNVRATRAHLLRAFAETGLPARWKEWDRDAPESPAHVRDYGSPTILVNGHDVAGASSSAGAHCCRIYTERNGQLSGIPSIESITVALVKATPIAPSNPKEAALQTGGWGHVLAVFPALGTAWLPICPACWPVYAGLLSSLGLGFINYGRYLLPMTAAFLILALVSLAYRAKTRRGYQPLALGILAAVMLVLIACPSCEVSVLDMKDAKVASRARSLGIRSVPAVVIDGKLADCCTGGGPQEATLRQAGLGQVI